MKRKDIMIDFADVEKIQMIIRSAYRSAELFLKNFDQNAWSPDFAMYNCMKNLIKMIEEWSEEKNKYIIEVADDKTVNIETSWNLERTVSAIFKNIDVIKSIIQTLADKTGAEYEVMIENLVEEIRSPLAVEW